MKQQQRTSGRLVLEGLACNLGEVTNISAGGMVVKGEPVEDDTVEVRLGEGTDAVTLKAERIWSEPAGSRLALTGYRFVDAPADLLLRLWGVHLPTGHKRVL